MASSKAFPLRVCVPTCQIGLTAVKPPPGGPSEIQNPGGVSVAPTAGRPRGAREGGAAWGAEGAGWGGGDLGVTGFRDR